jgi:hypothetical protein
MRIRIELLRPTLNPAEKLRAAGWEAESEGGNVFVAWHPHIADGGEAREDLDRMGLLTATHVRIEFLVSAGSGRPGAGGSPPGAGPPP